MQYEEGMDQISSSVFNQVLTLVKNYHYDSYTKQEVQNVLQKEHLTLTDYGVLLSPAAFFCLEDLAVRAKRETQAHFGNSISLFTPLYLSNYCENECVYCGFQCKNKIQRGKLSLKEIESEYQEIASTGLQEILLLTGESRHMSDVSYIGEAVKLATRYFSTIGIEIYPLNVEEYHFLKTCGADFVSVYQETYQLKTYDEVHIRGPKRVFPYRFHAQERALLGGMRGVAFGALLGLSDFRTDAFAAGIHAYFLQQKYPQAEISFSVPRLRPYRNNASNHPNDVHERQLLQVMLAYRIFLPFAGITISTRESAHFRDHVIGLAATKISAGVQVGVGGHAASEKGEEQFIISDCRDIKSVHQMLQSKGLQPVYHDYINVS